MRLQKYFASIENYEEKELKNKDEFAFNTFWIKVNCHWNLQSVTFSKFKQYVLELYSK